MKSLRPFGDAGENLGWAARWSKKRILHNSGVRFIGRVRWCRRNLGRKLQDIATLDARLHEDVFNERRDLSFFLGHRSDGQPVLFPGQRNVIQTALFLMVKM